MAEALSMLVNFASSALSLSSSKSHPSFDDGAVGLAIVAAMVGGESPPHPHRLPVFATSPAISSVHDWDDQEDDDEISYEFSEEDDEMEMSDGMSESYTCVTSFAEGRPVSKTVYLDDGGAKFTASFPAPPISNPRPRAAFSVGSPQSPPPPPLTAEEGFMKSCFLCEWSLDGLDIFMYRGEKPFCSPECRYEYILYDDHPGRTEVLKLLDGALPNPTPRPLGMIAAQQSSSRYLSDSMTVSSSRYLSE